MPRMLSDGRRLGAHLPLADGMVKAADRAHDIGANALQIFTDNPTSWARRAAPPTELPAFRSRLREHDIDPVAAHASYLINLAGPEPIFFERSIELLAHELHAAPDYGVRFVNVHIGSHRGAGVDAGIHRLADGVARALAGAAELDAAALEAAEAIEAAGEAPPSTGETPGTPGSPSPLGPPTLVLENSAGSGWGLGIDIDELAGIASAVADAGVDGSRLAFCLDTAHAWGAGVDVADPAATDAFLAEFDTRIGLDRLAMLHLNDSRSERGSRLDRHEHLGAGRIGEAGIAHLLRHPGLAHATYILETPGMDEGYDAVNLERARRLAAGEPLLPLPPEAFEVRSSRARTAPA